MPLPAISHADLMHPRIGREPFTLAGWVFEHKLDGFRALAVVEAGDGYVIDAFEPYATPAR